jgi:hypothetical protein
VVPLIVNLGTVRGGDQVRERFKVNTKVMVKQSSYRPGQAQRVPGI